MDAVTLALAKAYTNSQRIGYIEPGAKITFDGDATGKVTIPGSMIGWDEAVFVKVLDRALSADEIDSFAMYKVNADNSEEIMVLDKSVFYVRNLYGAVCFCYDEWERIISITEEASASFGIDIGTYVVCSDGEDGKLYVSEIRTTETIHPIDPKFLPAGGGATIIDLNKYSSGSTPLTAFIFALFQGGGGTMSASGVLDFWNDVDTDKNIKIAIDLSVLSALGLNMKIDVDGVTRVKSVDPGTYGENKIVFVAFSFMCENGGTFYRLNVVFNRDFSMGEVGSGMIVNVNVEPLTFGPS